MPTAVQDIETKAYGKVQVSEENKVMFGRGLYGLEKLHEYYILEHKEGPFHWLQSAESTEIAFIIIDPCYFMKDYKLELNKQDFIDIGLPEDTDKAQQDLLHYVIVTIPEDDPAQMTANLLGPLIINATTRQGKQAISLNPEYTTQHGILKELEAMNQEED